MKHVVIIGGGFAGLSALRRLGRYQHGIDVTLVDQREENHFLPLLPDMIGRAIPGELLKYPLSPEAARRRARFLRASVKSVDRTNRRLLTDSGEVPYDYLLIASGAQTNFYDHPEFAEQTYTVDSVDDCERIHARLLQDDFSAILVVGGGYAGVEMASVLWRYYRGVGARKRIVIIQKSASILQQLPERFIEYATDNLRELGVEIMTNESVVSIEGGHVELEGGRAFDEAMVLWTAGTRAADFVRDLPFEKNGQGRLSVDPHLRAGQHIYAAGNAAGFKYDGKLLRMGVQFSLMQGACAAGNILADIEGADPALFKPIDLGHVVPMANWKSCGVVLGMQTTGWLPTFLHYFMSVFRSYGLGNKVRTTRALLAS